MDNNTEKSVRQIAEFVGMEYNRVRGKLNDMGVKTNSMETKISLEDEKRFYKEIDFDPSKAKVQAPQAERVVRSPRRVSRQEEPSAASSTTATAASAEKTQVAKAVEAKPEEKKTTEATTSAERPKVKRKAAPEATVETPQPEKKETVVEETKTEKKAPAKKVVKTEIEGAPVSEDKKIEQKVEEKPVEKTETPEEHKELPIGSLICGKVEQETIDLSSLGSSTARAEFKYNRQPKPKFVPNGGQQNRPYGERNFGDRKQGGFGDRKAGGFGDRQNNQFGKKPDFRNRNNDDKDFMGKDQDDSKPSYMQKSQQGQRPGQRPSKPDAEISEPKRRDSGRDIDSAKREKKNDTKHGGNQSSGGGKSKFYDDSRINASNLSADEAMSDEYYSREESNKHGQKNAKKKNQTETNAGKIAQELKNVKIPPVIVVGDFAELIKKNANEVIMKLMTMGVMANRNQDIDFDTAALIADMYGITAEPEVVVSDEELLLEDPEDLEIPEDNNERPPVVVVMGHVDHGKTSLLDAIRKTSVTAGEAGGITQHIGAYQVQINNRPITFLDTPGHEAFTAMRARGAQVTDVAIIVVAADDGVMPQTIEAINHAKAANVSIVVAVNKIDKEGANIDRVKNEMAEQGIVCEDWGGDVPFIPVSAKQGTNIDELLETVILSADILELKASPTKQCKGTVIEAKLDKNKGPVATLLVQRGTLKAGDAILTESTFGHIRTMTNDKGRTIKLAGPSTPVEVTGLPEVPEAGKVFYVVNKDERLAKKVADERIAAKRQDTMAYTNKVTLEDLFSQIKAGEVKNLDIVVKTDVKGTAEAVKASLEKIGNEEVRVRVIHAAVGGVNESDVLLAEASNAIIIGFNVRPVGNVSEMAKEKGVDIKFYRVIYDAINDVKAAISGMLKPEFKENVIGHVEIRKTFKISGVGTIAGGYVVNGKVVRNSEARIVRDGVVIYEGHLASLKRFKDDVKEVAAGFECGLSFEKFDDLKEGDVIESYVMEEVARTIE